MLRGRGGGPSFPPHPPRRARFRAARPASRVLCWPRYGGRLRARFTPRVSPPPFKLSLPACCLGLCAQWAPSEWASARRVPAELRRRWRCQECQPMGLPTWPTCPLGLRVCPLDGLAGTLSPRRTPTTHTRKLWALGGECQWAQGEPRPLWGGKRWAACVGAQVPRATCQCKGAEPRLRTGGDRALEPGATLQCQVTPHGVGDEG